MPLVTSRTHPSPTPGPSKLQPLHQAEGVVSFCLGPSFSNELTSVMSVTQRPKLTRALPQTLLVESGTRGTQVPSNSQRDHHEIRRVTYTVHSAILTFALCHQGQETR